MKRLIPKILAAVALSIVPDSPLKAADLKPGTLNAWNEYIQAEDSRIAERVRSGEFLWSDQSPDRHRRVRNGEIVIAPFGENVPKSVPHGLIHHWVGAVFVPNARLDDIFAVVRDYRRYKEFYAPMVLESKALREGARDDRFSMLMLNKALFAKTAMDAEFQESYVQLDDRRWYSVAVSTRVQQVDNYGQADQHELPPNAGAGYIWRLYSLSRFEERDGGVYVELEAIALSRDIPISLRWIANPIVRRVSKGSLMTSLQKTEEAVRSTNEVASRAAKADGAFQPTATAGAFSIKQSLMPFTPGK
ncbi:MAG: hypothetical protein WAM39_29795 [Bryobacteraceae bacterium]